MLEALLFSVVSTILIGVVFCAFWHQARYTAYNLSWGIAYLLLGLATALGVALQWVVPDTWLHNAFFLISLLAFVGSITAFIAGLWLYLEISRAHWIRPLYFSVLGILILAVSTGGMAWGNAVSGTLLASCYLYMGGLLLLQGKLEKLAGLIFLLRGVMVLLGPIMAGTITSLQLSMGAVMTLASGLLLLLAAFLRAHQSIERKRAQYQSLLDDSLQGVVVIQDTPCYANPAAARIFGFTSPQEMLNNDALHACVPEKLLATLLNYHTDILAGRVSAGEVRAQFTRLDGAPLYLRVISSATQWQGMPAEQLLILDETSQVEAEQALQQLARFDQLTGLANKAWFLENLRLQLRADETQEASYALVRFNIDRFKHLNESWGDESGDRLLQQVAERLKQVAAGDMFASRLAADEFAVWLDVDGQLESPIQALKAHLETPYDLSADRRYFMTVKMGVACFPEDGTTIKDLYHAAAVALHDARTSPNQPIRYHDGQLNAAAVRRLALEQALREAIEQEAFEVYYQGKFTPGGVLVGCEALARWHATEFGWVSPMTFITLAERTGMIIPLGRIILKKVVEQLTHWRSAGLPLVPVAVNISALQLQKAGFGDDVLRLLSDHEIPTELIELEITESAAIAHLDAVKPTLEYMRSKGLALALDDFGTGQSSLKYLQQLPVSTLKIDRSFIAPLPDKNAQPIVRMLCSLAKALEMTIVAEGVETEPQARMLTMLGVDQIQGYLYAKPVTAEHFQCHLKGTRACGFSEYS